MDNKKFLGEKVAYHRDKLKLNRQEFIDRLNTMLGTTYSTQALYSWEKGKSIPPADMVPPLATLLGTNILEFYGVDFSDTSDLAETNDRLIQEIAQLQQKVESLTAENQRLIGKVEASEFFVHELMRQMGERENNNGNNNNTNGSSL